MIAVGRLSAAVALGATLSLSAVQAPAAELRDRHVDSHCVTDAIWMNALFVHATAECNRDFMDTNGGEYSLGLARQCVPYTSEQERAEIGKRSFAGFDRYKAAHGLKAACAWTWNFQKSIESHGF